MALNDLSDQEITRFISNYKRSDKVVGGKYALSDLLIEQRRRIASPFPSRDVAKAIVDLANSSSDGLVTYKELWHYFEPEIPWKGHASQGVLGKALGRVIALCVDEGWPILTTLVVRTDNRTHAERAVQNIYNEAKSLGFEVGLVPRDFVASQQAQSRICHTEAD